VSILDDPVLVLNRAWQVATFLPVRTAIVTTMRDMGSVLDPETYMLMTFDEWSTHEPKDHQWIKTAHGQIAAPQIIVLKKYGERPPRSLNFTRPNLYRRDDHSCQYCGSQLPAADLTIDHVLPRSRGGGLTWENAVAACKDCNSVKADQTPKEARMTLRRQPAKPNWTPKVRVPQKADTFPSWHPFLAKEGVAV